MFHRRLIIRALNEDWRKWPAIHSLMKRMINARDIKMVKITTKTTKNKPRQHISNT